MHLQFFSLAKVRQPCSLERKMAVKSHFWSLLTSDITVMTFCKKKYLIYAKISSLEQRGGCKVSFLLLFWMRKLFSKKYLIVAKYFYWNRERARGRGGCKVSFLLLLTFLKKQELAVCCCKGKWDRYYFHSNFHREIVSFWTVVFLTFSQDGLIMCDLSPGSTCQNHFHCTCVHFLSTCPWENLEGTRKKG